VPDACNLNLDDPDLVSVYDEIPLWSAPFGFRLLNTVRFRRNISALDIGCGTGFPLLDLAQRLGESCHVTGLDPWDGAYRRIGLKMRTMNIRNVTPVLGVAEHMPFADAGFDLIVSNNGLNNVTDPEAAMKECARVSRSGAQLVLTVNLPETMKEFYEVYERVLRARRMDAAIVTLHQHIQRRRKPAAWTVALVERAGFRVESVEQDVFTLAFADGTALLNHFFVRLAFLQPWKDVVPEPEQAAIFRSLEETLNQSAPATGGLRLTVPFVCLSAVRPGS
jgi:ubiquinone/menaquinone biosynthesis C-methylase UbiE